MPKLLFRREEVGLSYTDYHIQYFIKKAHAPVFVLDIYKKIEYNKLHNQAKKRAFWANNAKWLGFFAFPTVFLNRKKPKEKIKYAYIYLRY